ncbi:RND superfamily putative drug exporter [Paenibacillus rhizosphaerae]|uniref:RND superfamily putative drug exporter n=1 Tax=Paenibacillus rhizosphaerae TaxID=297318 RepID=A0A839TRP7_9BACL|nr:MMPL family transporter [Paenibacillus rhizosphaerae]MBB3128078.1 RND superfamily putative drug exporter [Paenibacillus rhizosphaerae]
MIYRFITGLVLRYPAWVLACWTALLVICGSAAISLPSLLKDHGLRTEGTSTQVERILSEVYHIPRDPAVIVFQREPGASRVMFEAGIRAVLEQLRRMDGNLTVISPLDHERMMDNQAAYALLGLNTRDQTAGTVLDAIRTALPEWPGVKITLTGKPVVQDDVNRASMHDLKRAELIGLPLAFLILFYAFGGWIYALIPIAAGCTAVGVSMGILYWLGSGLQLELSNFVLNVIPMVGLALGIDFGLILVSRFREEWGASSGRLELALSVTLRQAGRAVIYSAACVILGLIAITFIRMPMFRSVAIGAMVVVFVSALVNLTLVPAFLTLCSPVIPIRRNSAVAADTRPGLMQRWTRYVMRRPVRMMLVSAALLLTSILPIRYLQTSVPDASSLPSSYPSRLGAELVDFRFNAPFTSVIPLVVLGRGYTLSAEEWRAAYGLWQRLKMDRDVLQVDSIFSYIPTLNDQPGVPLSSKMLQQLPQNTSQPLVREGTLLMSVTLQPGMDAKQTEAWLEKWEIQGQNERNIRILLGGEAKYRQEVSDEIKARIPSVLLWMAITNFAVLFAGFRSIIIPLKALLMNMLSLTASFGVLVYFFQEGMLGAGSGSIAVMIPVFIFGLVFGVSMDYGVFLLSRMTEVYHRTGNAEKAIAAGLSSTGKVITSAAAIMIAVTLPFTAGDVEGVRQLGFGIAAAILIDATLIRFMLVPALMKLMGHVNWWLPHPLRRWLFTE